MESVSALSEEDFALIVKKAKELAKVTRRRARAQGLSSESAVVTDKKPNNPRARLVNVPVDGCKSSFHSFIQCFIHTSRTGQTCN
jgi:hypothetical protein